FEYTTEQVERYVIDPELSRAIAWKYDKRILPAIFFMCKFHLFACVCHQYSRSSQTGTLEKDLHMKGNQYNNVITITTAAYSAFCIFGGLLTRRFGPTRMLPLYMLGCGSMSVLNAAARNYKDIMVIRFFLGMAEGLFMSSGVVYLASIYTRGELGKRMAIWYSASAVSGAFSGLLAYGVFHIHSALAGWKILLMIQGGMTIVAALLAAWVLPNGPQHAVFLTPLEKEVAVMRYASKHIDAPFSCSEFFAPLYEWKFYVLAAFGVCYGTSSITANTFLPQIIQRFNFGTVKTNLYTVAPNIAATLFLWACAWASDRARQRSFFVILSMSLSLVGYVVLAALPISALGAAYFACFLISMGSFVPSPLFHSWHNNNEPSENGRAFRAGFYVLTGNSGGLVSANIFLDSDAPKYMHALIISASLQLIGMCLVLGIRTHMVLENRRRNREQGVKWTNRDVPTADLKEGPDSPGFRYFL
ncbi:MFS general substrate transporter, partial [Favolaschia claudopus]